METPPIADKFRFWEEQDRINKELIPRVIKQYELFTQHVETHESASSHIAALEARLAERDRMLRSIRRRALGISGLGRFPPPSAIFLSPSSLIPPHRHP